MNSVKVNENVSSNSKHVRNTNYYVITMSYSYWIGSMFNVYSSMVETDDLLYNIFEKSSGFSWLILNSANKNAIMKLRSAKVL